MPGSFWKSLGSKLVETGAAYLQQVRVVNELKQLSPDEARQRFAQYVSGLSATARAGFAVTLATLANSETSAKGRHFIESLRAALANPNATMTVVEAEAAPPAASYQSDFDADLQRVSDWNGIEGDRRDRVIGKYVDELNMDGLQNLRTHLEQMQTNCAANIQAHRDDEARFADGRRTGQHNADWSRRLTELQEWAAWFDALHAFVSQEIDERQRPSAPSRAPAPQSARRKKRTPNRTAREDVLDLLQLVRNAMREGRVTGDLESEVAARISKLRAFSDEDQICISMAPSDVMCVMAETLEEAGIDDTETIGHFRELYEQARSLRETAFGDASPWRRSRQVVVDMAKALEAGADRAAALAEASTAQAAIEGLSGEARAESALGIHGLDRHYFWLGAVQSGIDAPVFRPWQRLRKAMPAKGPTPAWVAKAVDACYRAHAKDDASQAEARMTLALALAGCAIASRQDVLPGLLPLQNIVFEAASAGQQAAPPDFTARARDVIARFDVLANSEGVSQFRLNQAIAEIKELPQAEDGSDAPAVQGALIELIDHALPRAPSDAQASMRALRQTLSQMIDAPTETLDIDSWLAQGEAAMARLRAALSSGADAGGALTEMFGALQLLGLRAPDDQRVVDHSMVWGREIMLLAAQHAPPDKQEWAQQVVQQMGDTLDLFPDAVAAEGVDADIADTQVRSKISSLAQLVDVTHPDGEVPGIEIAVLLRNLQVRMSALEEGVIGMDEKEAKRLSARAASAIEGTRGLTLATHLVEQLRRFIRPLAVEILRFERRRHLMLIEPPWSTEDVVAEPNVAFARVGERVRPLLEEVASVFGITDPTLPAHAEYVQQRWLQLRASPVAVFDFTTYDPALCDPRDLPADPEQEAALLASAAPTAQGAYEAGWALVLGVPMVIVAEEGRPLPFDLDVEATRLRGDDGDVFRLAAAINRATLGAQRGTAGDGLPHLLEHLRARVAGGKGSSDPLESVTDTRDGLRVRFASEFALRGAREGKGSMLVLPAFPSVAPSREPELFHVTAFRPWMAPVEGVLRAASRDHGVTYRIGHEDLDPQIVRSVWTAIAQARCVVCDITLLNPNAVLELAVAQAMGRPVLILSRHVHVARWLPALAKVRGHTYTVDPDGLRALRALVDRFLNDSTSR